MEKIESAMGLGGFALAFGIGGQFGLWWGLIAAGSLLFSVAASLFVFELRKL